MAQGKKKIEAPKSTAQQLASIIKSCRDIMRKDKGLNGDLDRLPMLTWIMFVKFLDDTEKLRADEAAMAAITYHPTVEAPYRWRDWNRPNGTGLDDGIHNALTGDDLIAFIGQDEAI